MSNLKVKMSLNSEKKHSVRYDAVDGNDPAVSSIYVLKHSLPKPYPENITVSIELE